MFALVNLELCRPCGWRASTARNVLFVLPRADIVAVFLEASTIIRDPLGTTTGEPRFALTQVVEGFGAKDLGTDIYQWLVDVLEEFDGHLGDRVRKPGRVRENFDTNRSPNLLTAAK